MDSIYRSTVMQRPADEDDERLRRERIVENASAPSTASSSTANPAAANTANAAAANTNPIANTTNPNPRQFDSRSPTQSEFHHPPPPPGSRGFSPQGPQFNNPYHPPTPAPLPMPAHSHISGPPASPRGVAPSQPYSSEYSPAPREKSTSSYYDPTSDSGERRPAENASWHDAQSRPAQVRTGSRLPCTSITNLQLLTSTSQSREPYQAYPATAEPSKYYNGSYTSPVSSTFPPRSPVSHAHPPRPSSISQSPSLPPMASPVARQNGAAMGGPTVKQETAPLPAVSIFPVPISNNPSNDQVQQTPSRPADPMAFSSILSNAEPPPPQPTPTPASKPRKTREPKAVVPKVEPLSRAGSRQSSAAPTPAPAARVPNKRKANGEVKAKSSPKPKQLSLEQEKEIQALLAQLDAEASDLDSSDFEDMKKMYKVRTLKRKLDLDAVERGRSKLRRTQFAEKMATRFGNHAQFGEDRYRAINQDAAVTAVQEREVQAEKERKKDMQRKRRREKTVATNIEQKEIAMAKAQAAEDEQERQKFIREAQRAEKKAQQTKIILARGEKGPEISAVSPIEPNFAGGMMSTFTTADAEPKPKSKRGGARLRKSKEQKQAEKDSAEAAQAAIDAGEEPSQSATTTKDEPRIRIRLNAKESKENREETPATFEPFVSKGYNQIYDQIWRDLARKDVSKVYKLAADSYNIKSSNLKKTAILASKEAKRWQLRTNKGTKDLQARAKRVMREMMSFWKRNEREDRDLRRAAEKQEIEAAKKAEADREANRQKRKLNFLISQTELYSHFIGKKIKTDEVERSTDHPDEAVTANEAAQTTIKLPDGTVTTAGKVTNFENLDFDADDDSALQAAAMANAQHAIQEAQNKARAFNKDEGPTMDEEGEMNFQNPAGMGDVDIEQPKMLQAQLKEYQLKGLNWLVNLYEQGINGILADEMGLGKTVQSISVMAYLAEKHGIWGPFLVVAPASTLHNWQQEITKFVPTLKVLPYWGTAGDRKVLRKFWDRKHITYTQDAPFHVLVTSYQLVVSDVNYFQKMRWQYMILDEAQAIKSSQSSRWKSLLGFHCRNRLLLTGTPIQNNMQELWALLHFIMPSLFDSHDEFSEWFSKDIESHAQSNTKLNEDQLKRLHMILKPFMLRRVKKHVQKELGDKIEEDVFCDLTYRQRAYYSNLRNQISIMDLIEKATVGDDNDTGTLMNLVMQFRKVCNHPDLFERAETTSPFSFGHFAETASFMREGPSINLVYSTRNLIEYNLPRLIWRGDGRLDLPGQKNETAGFKSKYLSQLLNIFTPGHIREQPQHGGAFSWLRFADSSVGEASNAAKKTIFNRGVDLAQKQRKLGAFSVIYDEEGEQSFTPAHALFNIVDRQDRKPLAEVTNEGYLNKLLNLSKDVWADVGLGRMEQCGGPAATAPPIEVVCSSRGAVIEKENILFNVPARRALYGPSPVEEKALVTSKIPPSLYPPSKMLPAPTAEKTRFTNIRVPSMRRFVTDSGKLAKLDKLLFKLKEGGHRVLLYFQMTKMIDLMEEFLTYRNYKYLRLDGSTKLEDRRDTVHDFQTRPEIFIFLLSTRAGGLGINLTSADTVIFYDSDWNPTIDSQAMDRAHRLGQTRQVTVYRMITRGTIEERIRKRALQKEEVQKVVMTGGAGVDFNTRSKENRTKDIAMWLVDDDEAAEIERKEAEMAALEASLPEKVGKKPRGRKRKVETGASGSLEDLYHEGELLIPNTPRNVRANTFLVGEGHFDDGSNRPSGAATPVGAGSDIGARGKKPKKMSGKKAKTAKQRLAMADGDVDMG
jgi:DNA helicase INO80